MRTQSMNKLWIAVGAVIAAAAVLFIFRTLTQPAIRAAHPLIDYQNMTYTIDKKPVTLVNGTANQPIASGTASSIVTQYFGDNLYQDLNSDGVPDAVFLVTQQSGGSGTFYYVVAAVSTATSSVGSHGYFLGDRIAPESITPGPNHSVIVTYADRGPTQDFSMPPSEGKRVELTLDPNTLNWIVAASSTATSTATSTDSTASSTATTSVTATTTALTSSFDPHAIPLGDGKISSGPRVGYVFSCTTNFRQGGVTHAGNWINGTHWDMSSKPTVQGNVLWPHATFSTYLSGNKRILEGNGLPVNTPTGVYPIAASDPAYQYDHNPNAIKAQNILVTLPEYPSFASGASCVPMGPIGYALNGVAIYNALDAGGRDAVAHEVQDSCSGHPQSAGEYHYHGPSPCMPNATSPNTLVGYALDGFGIYSQYKADGTQYTNADLDACHGTTSPVLWNGTVQSVYHYVMTAEYPYTVGCFRGTPVQTKQAVGSSNTPPPAALAACSNSQSGASCSFSSRSGTVVRGTCRIPPGSSALACVTQ